MHTATPPPVITSAMVKQLARQAGFDACGLAAVEPLDESYFGLRQWLAEGRHADMEFMEQHVAMRHNPALLVEGARTVISLLLAYKPSSWQTTVPRLSCYAYGEDYHLLVKRKLYELMALLRHHFPAFDAKPCVDTVPISDKLWAVKAGLGWIGKNTLLVNPRLGSFCYIGELVTCSAADSYDTPIQSQCGNCTRCLDACPNQAISPMQSDRCISYNTIENRHGQLPSNISMRGYAFGCDCCQQVCPFNIQAPVSHNIDADRMSLLNNLPQCDKAAFNKFKKTSALSRITFDQWQRNCNMCRADNDHRCHE